MATLKFQNRSKKLKILFLTNIISPYMSDLFNHFAKYSEEVDFKVVACSYTEPDREWSLEYLNDAKYKFKILKDVMLFKVPKKTRFFYLGGLSLIKEIFKYDAIIFKGGTRFVGPLYAFLAKAAGIKTVLWEENSIDMTNTFMKNLIKSIYINKNLFSSFIAYGSHVKELIEKFNKDIPHNKIFFSYSPVNNEKFRSRYLKLLPKKGLIRKKLNIPSEKKVLLFIGRFVDEKNLFVLVNAVEKMVKSGEENIVCSIIGGGNLKDPLENYIKEKKLENYIKMIPFLEFDKLTMFYSIADVFVLPSKFEAWGLVVNEAMNFNLPVIVSDKVGCAQDLVKNGINGYVFPFKNSEKLAECILKSINNSEVFGENSHKIIKNVNFDALSQVLIDSASV